MIQFARNLIFADFWLKLFSLALAVLIWFTVSFAIQRKLTPISNLAMPTSERTFFDVPITVMASAQDVRAYKVEPKVVDITIQGPTRAVQDLALRDVHPIVDLSGIESATVLARRIEVSTPVGVTHVRLVPEEVRVIVPPAQ
jgi:YbbR domain-containing protein